MGDPGTKTIIDWAIEETDRWNRSKTDGKWLQDLTVLTGPHIKEWDLADCWAFADWPDREEHFPVSTKQDTGIDVVARRRSDGRYVAIQCKSRQLDDAGRGASIPTHEVDKFIANATAPLWRERWIVTNGENPLTSGSEQKNAMQGDRPLRLVNVTKDLLSQQQANAPVEECEHCRADLNPDPPEPGQTRTCMQDEAVRSSVRLLEDLARSESGGLPTGEARGRIILPCGTGKTRISLRIIERLTPPGELAVVLCPSIALVAQIRREYLQHAETDLDILAVCSDDTAGYDPQKESSLNAATDPTVDNGYVSASEVKGKVTTSVDEIAEWMRSSRSGRVNVLVGTYQSSMRVSEALDRTGITARVLIADEAHRTAGLKRQRATSRRASEQEQRIRDFTVCHDQKRFPVRYRVYQTATPRIYDGKATTGNANWIVRSMDDENVFGVELYRKSYLEAVRNGWLSDYRIIAMGVNDPDAFATANALAKGTKSGKLTSDNYLRGMAFALALGGATQGEGVDIRSCIAFMNTVDKSRHMAADLQTDPVKEWVERWLQENGDGRQAADYRVEHLDATSKAISREDAKRRLAAASPGQPHAVINVGIFGEGTDSPSLSAVAFLEPRRSPVDVVQAVGRAMRTAPGKEHGYIICPIQIPPSADPETWLSTSAPDEGWQELGQILRALRAHDQRIEENLAGILSLYIPKPPPVERTLIAIGREEERRIVYREFEGPPGAAQEALEQVLDGKKPADAGMRRVGEEPRAPYGGVGTSEQSGPTQILTGKQNEDGSVEIRMDSVQRDTPKAGETRGAVNIEKSKARAREMINEGKRGIPLPRGKRAKPKPPPEDRGARMLRLSGLEDHGAAISMNLLERSGLTGNRVTRDLNILESSVSEAARHLKSDGLLPELNRHLGLDRLKQADDGKHKKSKRADGCVTATLLMMNAAMLHQRIANGRWLSGVSGLSDVKNDVDVIRTLRREWERIMRHDFRPVLEPAVEAIDAIERTGKTAGLERALRHLAAEAERIAETYADMGADHAGPLFNRVMGDQASDGAFFTRPAAAAIAARLTLDVCGEQDWTNPNTWREHKALDPACGSGTLLAALLSEMKRRAVVDGGGGSTSDELAQLQKLAVEDVIRGLEINPVSLQLAASQLTAGNRQVGYRRMGLHRMPYGPDVHDPNRAWSGSLELLGQRAVVQPRGEIDLEDEAIASQSVWAPADQAELEDALDAVRDVRIVIMNPPFTNRSKLGEKFPEQDQRALRRRVDAMEQTLVRRDLELQNFVDKNSVGPLFVALADHILDQRDGVLTMINPTIALSAPSGLRERQILARRFHVHTVVTCHQPKQISFSQHTNINDSVVVLRRHDGSKPPTRFVNLDRMPKDDAEVAELHRALLECERGLMTEGWGEVSHWPASYIKAGDWTPALWRSPELAEAARRYASHADLRSMEASGLSPQATGRMLRGSFEPAASGAPGSFPILKSTGADAQTTITSAPDEHWLPKRRDEGMLAHYGGVYPEAERILAKAGYLLVTAGQDASASRLTAVAGAERHVGNGWIPVGGTSPEQAKAAAIFVNSTPGRLQLMRTAGRKLDFPRYSVAEVEKLRIPDIDNDRIRGILADCWERTRDMTVPPFREGECEVRRLWDEAVAEAMGWDADELARLRLLLHREPHVRGLGRNQYADEPERDQ